MLIKKLFANSDDVSSATQPSAEINSNNILCLGGSWTVHNLQKAKNRIDALKLQLGNVQEINLHMLSGLDTTGAMLINQIAQSCNSEIIIRTNNQGHAALLQHCQPPRPEKKAKPPLWPLLWLNTIGKSVVTEFYTLKDILAFLGLVLVTTIKSLLRPRTIPFPALVYHMDQVGVRALPIVCLLSFLIGMVIAYMAAAQLVLFGAQILVVPLLEVATTREMGVLITAILVAGRSGSSFTAQIGSMVANEEVDAMRSIGLDPILLLVLPRVLALILMLPILVMAADIMSILGGLCAVWFSLDITPTTFITALKESVNNKHFFVGMAKTPFFATVIGCVGCFLGFQVTGSSDSVGRLTTQAVVESIFLVITLDALFALFFNAIGV